MVIYIYVLYLLCKYGNMSVLVLSGPIRAATIATLAMASVLTTTSSSK